jgi:hypothetical protein
MKTFSIKNIFNKQTNKSKFVKIINPDHDWQTALKIYFFMSLILIVFSFYFLNKIKNDEFFHTVSDSKESLVGVDQKMLDNILTSFKNKEEIIQSIKSGGRVLSDPGK